ncbi:MAG: IS5 family transposase, partial [Cyanobacteria bacterium J06642_2]
MSQKGFWDWEERHQKLSHKKPLLDRLNEIVPWDEFRPLLERIHQKERKSQAGRKPIDVILMFKLLLLQKFYNISDESLEYQVNDRLSFMKFLGLGIEDTIPDATTVWSFREKLMKLGLIRELFDKFDDYLILEGYEAKEGQIVDATLIPVPLQRNSRKENEKLRKGEIPEEWEEKPHKLSQKDLEALWVKKNVQNHFGYKNHISVDVKYGLVRQY